MRGFHLIGLATLLALVPSSHVNVRAWSVQIPRLSSSRSFTSLCAIGDAIGDVQDSIKHCSLNRRSFLTTPLDTTLLLSSVASTSPLPAYAVGPIKVPLKVTSYTAAPCPKDRPIPGEKAMKGMRGLCVTVEAEVTEQVKRPELFKVGVYGFITDEVTGESGKRRLQATTIRGTKRAVGCQSVF